MKAEGLYLGKFEELVLLSVVKLTNARSMAFGFTVKQMMNQAGFQPRSSSPHAYSAVYVIIERLIDRKFLAETKSLKFPGGIRRIVAVTPLGLEALAEAERIRQELRKPMEVGDDS